MRTALVTRTTLDQRSRTDRFSIPSGDHLRGFGVGDFGELVTRLVAKAEIPSMTGGKQPLRIRGADALSAPLARTPDSLVADLDVLESILDEPAAAELEVLEQLVVIKHKPELIETLEGALSQALATPDQARLGLSWPHEHIDENGTPTSFKIMGAGRAWAHVQDGTPELGFLLDALSTDKPDERLDRLKRMRVQLFRDADGEEPISTAIPGLKWLAFETEAEGKRYCLHDATWYLMDQDYARRLRERTQAIFDPDPGISLPEWPRHERSRLQRSGSQCAPRHAIGPEVHLHRPAPSGNRGVRHSQSRWDAGTRQESQVVSTREPPALPGARVRRRAAPR